jgi:hypothetical protein
VRLHDLATGKQTWPPVQPRDMSIFAPQLYPGGARYSADWCLFREAQAEEVKAEQERVSSYYQEQARQKALREEREDRERAASK